MELTSAAFKAGEAIPARYTCDGRNVSPPLQWTGVPPEARSLVLMVDDPDAPSGDWVHWIVYDLPPGMTALAEDVPATAAPGETGKQGVNDFKKPGYGGPCPPGGKAHRYFFRLYALDAALDLKSGATKKEVAAAMARHIVAQTQLMGIYTRK